MIESSTCF